MRIIIEVDNDKTPTVSSSEQTTAPGNSLTSTAQPVTTIDGGAAPTGQDEGSVTDSSPLATTSGVTVIDGGTAPSFSDQ